MRHGRPNFIVAIAICLSGQVIAQQQIFKTYSVNDGLVHNAVRCIYQDSKGFIWIGTWEGLSKYDGHKFTNYTTVNGLSHSLVNTIHETENGDIYIALNDGSLNVIRKGKSIEKLQGEYPIINRLMYVPGKKTLALTDFNGFFEFNKGEFKKPTQSFPRRNYYDIAPFNDSLYIAISDSSAEIIDHRYALFSEQKENTPFFGECRLLVDANKRIWVGTNNGLRLLSPEQKKYEPLKFSALPGTFNFHPVMNQVIRDLLEDNEGNIWIGTNYGLAKVSPDGSKQIITEKNGLPSSDVACIFQDTEKNIWIGTSRGLAKLVTKTRFSIYTTDNGLVSNNLTFLVPFQNGDMVLGSDKEPLHYSKTENVFTTPDKRNLSHDADSSNRISVKYAGGTLYQVINSKDPKHIYYSPGASGVSIAFKDRFDNYFTYSHSGIYTSRDLMNWKTAIHSTDTRTMLIDSKGHLWAGTYDKGLYRFKYDIQNNEIVLTDKKIYYPEYGFRSIYEDKHGNIWAGSRYNGVYLMKPAAQGDYEVKQFDLSSGLTSNRVTSIGEDKDGIIWLSFYHGLDKLIPHNNSFRVFNFSRFNNFFTNIQDLIFDHDHSMWLATTQGLINIRDGNAENIKPLKTYITKAILGDSTYFDYDKKVILKNRHRQVQFEFAAPGFINEKQVLYSYRLLGSNNSEWSAPANEYSVSYANLQPGNYIFEVRTTGWNGENGEPAHFEFRIMPPFWQTWWFLISSFLILSLAVFIAVRRRIKNIRHEAALKHKIAETEMKALRAQMNPHFIFNSLNAIDNLVQTNQPDRATTYLARFAKLIRAVLDSSKHNVVSFQSDIETLRIYLQMEQFRTNNKFEYDLDIDPELISGDYKVPPLLIQPFLENAIQHGLLNKERGERKLYVAAKLEDDHILYTIMDNGIGRTKAAGIKELNRPEHISHGMKIIRERVDLHNAPGSEDDIRITDLYENDTASGTKVEVRVKLNDQRT